MEKPIELGSFYCDGTPYRVNVQYPGGTITLGNTVQNTEIHWLRYKSMLVADRCLCTNVPWDILNHFGLIFGTVFCIEGQYYWCRVPKMGTTEDDPCEWSDIVDAFGNDNNCLHFMNQYSLGQESVDVTLSDGSVMEMRAVRGYFSGKARSACQPGLKAKNVGWRPILEPLEEIENPNDLSFGADIILLGGDRRSIQGRLVDATDYDMELALTTPLPDNCRWAVQDRSRIVASRESVAVQLRRKKTNG